MVYNIYISVYLYLYIDIQHSSIRIFTYLSEICKGSLKGCSCWLLPTPADLKGWTTTISLTYAGPEASVNVCGSESVNQVNVYGSGSASASGSVYANLISGNQPSTFYHTTNLKTSLAIQDAGFRVPPGSGCCLGPGVYFTTTFKKAVDYLKCQDGGVIFEFKVDLGTCKTMTVSLHPTRGGSRSFPPSPDTQANFW